MSKRRPGLSRAEHQVIGKELQRAHASLTTAVVEAVNAYGPGNRRIRRIEGRARTAINALMTIRSELEELLAEHHSDWQVSDYYGEPPAENLAALLAALRTGETSEDRAYKAGYAHAAASMGVELEDD